MILGFVPLTPPLAPFATTVAAGLRATPQPPSQNLKEADGHEHQYTVCGLDPL